MLDKIATWLWTEFLRLLPPSMHRNGNRDNVEKAQLYEQRLRRWRWAVCYWLVGVIWATVVIAGFAFGVPKVYAGLLATKDEVEKNQKEVVELKEEIKEIKTDTKQNRIETLEATMFDLKIKQCEAKRKQESQLPFTIRISDFQKKYVVLKGNYYDLPECAELE